MPIKINDLIIDRNEVIRNIILDKIIPDKYDGYWDVNQILINVRKNNVDKLPVEAKRVRKILHSLVKKGIVSAHLIDGTIFYKFRA